MKDKESMKVSLSSEECFTLCQEIFQYFYLEKVREVDHMTSISPPWILLDEPSATLGISLLIIKQLYSYTYEDVFHRIVQLKEAKGCQITQTDSLSRIFNLSYSLLALNGDLFQIYNLRKQFIVYILSLDAPGPSFQAMSALKDYPHSSLPLATASSASSIKLSLLNKELSFLSAIFTKYPKSPAAWEHRRWCLYERHKLLSEIKQARVLTSSDSTSIPSSKNDFKLSLMEIETEKELTRIMASKYPKNYYAWTHRQWLLPYMTAVQLDEELLFTEQWLLEHVSDHSAVNHRMQIIMHALKSVETLQILYKLAVPERDHTLTQGGDLAFLFLFNLLKTSGQMIASKPGYESLWCQRRHLAEFILQKLIEQTRGMVPDSEETMMAEDSIDQALKHLKDNLREVTESLVPGAPETSTLASLSDSLISSFLAQPSPSTFFLIFFQKEIDFFFFILLNKALWNYLEQVCCGLKYLVFLAERMQSIFKGILSSTLEEKLRLLKIFLLERIQQLKASQ